MHIWVLLMVCFWTAQPAADGKPAQAESAHTASAIFFSAEACNAVGETTASSLAQTPGVSHAGYACVEVVNPNDKPV